MASIDSDSIFGRFELAERPALVAAVSGGSDSLGLLFLLKDHLGRCAPATQIVAVTIDHGLRAEAAGEARAVAALCHAQGITHRTLRWTAAKPATGLPAAAREARYRLLAEAAATEGTDLVLTGHTLDDQIETVDMRRARGAKGPGDGRGLAGMAPATLYDGRSWLLRPLLGTERAALRAWLTERAIGWIDDPTNVDSKYERARLRAATAIGQDTQSARSRIAAAASERAALGEAAAALIRTHAKLAAPGLVALNLAFAERRRRRSGGLCTAHHACGHRRYGAASRCQERRCAVRAHRSGELPLDAVTGGDRRHGTRDLSAPGRARLARTFAPAAQAVSGTGASGSATCRKVRRSRPPE